MKNESEKRAAWLREYEKLRDSQTPTECARCGFKGWDWTHRGGNFESHHPYRRRTRWATLCFLSLCPRCHKTVEDNASQARKEGWIIDPTLHSMFE